MTNSSLPGSIIQWQHTPTLTAHTGAANIAPLTSSRPIQASQTLSQTAQPINGNEPSALPSNHDPFIYDYNQNHLGPSSGYHIQHQDTKDTLVDASGHSVDQQMTLPLPSISPDSSNADASMSGETH